MTTPIATYSFLPWLRRGLANQITAADADPAVRVRALIDVELAANGDKLDGSGVATLPVKKQVALFGPGDIVGIERRAIVRTEPHDWITNYEPNYLPFVEFYDEDFPWRYTPAAPDTAKSRLRPWITLLVLRDDGTEFTEGATGTAPLPYIDVANLDVFPRADELWAWAHVHVNRNLAGSDDEFVSSDMGAVIPRLEAVLAENADLAYSRLMAPRKLAENTGYHAFLIPTFEAGRRAGLGLELGDIPATMSAWDAGARPQGQSFPYYHRWYFRTGQREDFETLVRLLKPKPVDPRVGLRDMDVQAPGSDVPGVDNPDLHGVLRLGGALRRPTDDPPDVYEKWDEPFPRPLQTRLAQLLNFPEQYAREGDPDPVITPPIYGRWHAMMDRVLTDSSGADILPSNNWVHRLNLDPRFRVAAGFGTRVIQDRQEEYMDAAWDQIGQVLEAQRRIRQGQMARAVSQVWFDRHLEPMVAVNRQQALMLIAPLNKRVLTGDVTLHHALGQALVQPPMTSTALRRVVRPRGRLVKSLPFDATRPAAQLAERVNAGEVSAAPPKATPPALATPDQASDTAMPADAPPFIIDLLRRIPRMPELVRILALVLLILGLLLFAVTAGLSVVLLVLAVAAYAVSRTLAAWRDALQGADALREDRQTPDAVDALPAASNFEVAELPTGGGIPPFEPRPGADSVEAARFKRGLRETFQLVQASAAAGAKPPLLRLDLAAIARDTLQALHPAITVPRRVRAGIVLPPRIVAETGPAFVEPMAYPVIGQPMYEPLAKLSSELFLPNLNLIEQNTITLLETNERFIEAYMTGLNHEFARELLWREYPTDQRCSTFRQFWDVSGYFDPSLPDDATRAEKLRDITPLHTWATNSELGTHNNRRPPGQQNDQLVLVIRGELLKRYPNAVIYAHRACWHRDDDGTPGHATDPCAGSGAIDRTRPRLLRALTSAEEAAPPTTKVRTPLYHAKVDPDIYFLGFDLTREEARGGTGEHPNDDPGWFFVIKERPGEPRFGLDIDPQPVKTTWNDLAWADVQPGPAGSYIEIATSPAGFTLVPASGDDPDTDAQHGNDTKVAWSHGMSAAELAYILFQVPVLVAVHASDMLEP